MNLDNLDEITRLRGQRDYALKLTKAISAGDLGDFHVWIDGQQLKFLPFVNEPFIRAAISYAAEMELDIAEKRLKELGVSMPRRDETVPTVEIAMSQLKMYQNSWVRALGGSVRNKRHLIDALACTTEDLRKKAMMHSGPVVAKALHDARVTELLEFNNRAEQRAREAERKLKRFMEGTPAERLAFAVEQAAASTTAAIKQEG